jgi:hypothetical protein
MADEKVPLLPKGPQNVIVTTSTSSEDKMDDSCASAGCCYNRKSTLQQLESSVRSRMGFLIAGSILNWFIAWSVLWSIFGYASTLASLICAAIITSNIGFPNRDPQGDAVVVALLIAGSITVVAAFLGLIMLCFAIVATIACGLDSGQCTYHYYGVNGNPDSYESALALLITLTILVGVTTICYFCNGILSIDGALKYRRLITRRQMINQYVAIPQQQQQPIMVTGVPVTTTTTSTGTKLAGTTGENKMAPV